MLPEPRFTHEGLAEALDEVGDGVQFQDGGDSLVLEVIDVEEDTGDPEKCEYDALDQVQEVGTDGGDGRREQRPGREERIGQEQVEKDLQMVECRRMSHDQRDDIDNSGSS